MMIHDAVIMYEAIYNAFVRVIGLEMTINLTLMKIEGLDKAQPAESIKEFLKPLIDFLGEPSVKRIIKGALEDHFVSKYADECIQEIGL